MTLKKFFLYREYHYEATVGKLIEEGKYGNICCTLERPKLNNQRDNPKTKENESSCIPEGDYLVGWTKSNKFTTTKRKKYKKEGKTFDEEKDVVYTFEITGVKSRDGIRIHAANTVDELFGCIAPAMFIGNNIRHSNDKVYPYYASGSGTALLKLEKYILQELALTQFTLSIVSDSACKVDNKQIINQNGAL